jgi:hypothetical protein
VLEPCSTRDVSEENHERERTPDVTDALSQTLRKKKGELRENAGPHARTAPTAWANRPPNERAAQKALSTTSGRRKRTEFSRNCERNSVGHGTAHHARRLIDGRGL